MTVITIRNVPEALNSRLKDRARERGQSLQQFLLTELEEVAERSALEDRLREVLERHPEVNLTRAEFDRGIQGMRVGREW